MSNVVDSGWLDADIVPTTRINWRVESVSDQTTGGGTVLFDAATGLFDSATGQFDSH